MNRDNDRQTSIILAVLGILPIVWLGLLIAPSVKGGLPEILPSLMNVMSDPFHIVLCEDSVKTVLVLLLCYGMGIGIYTASGANFPSVQVMIPRRVAPDLLAVIFTLSEGAVAAVMVSLFPLTLNEMPSSLAEKL